MQVEVVEKEGLKRELNIEVPADIVTEAYGKVYEEFRKNAKIKGFRPGKVPVAIIRSRFKQEVTAELVEDLVGKYLAQAIQEQKLDPVGKPVISKIDVDEGKPLVFTVGIEVMPDIAPVNFDNLVVNEPEMAIPDKAVDDVIEQLRKNNADVRVVDRPAREDDLVIADLETIEGDLDPGDTPMTNREIDLGNQYTVEEFRKGLAGVRRDEIRNIEINYPQDYPDEKFAGKKVLYKAAVKEVKERVLPIVNDHFAKEMAGAGTLLELRLDIRKRIEMDMRQDVKRADKRQIIDHIVAQNPIQVPEVMVESYLNGLVEDIKRHEQDVKEDEVRQNYRPAAVHAVRWYLLHQRLAAQENIEVSPADTENWTKRFAESYRMDIAKAAEVLAKSGRADEIKDGILEEKVVDFLMSKAEVKKVALENKEGQA